MGLAAQVQRYVEMNNLEVAIQLMLDITSDYRKDLPQDAIAAITLSQELAQLDADFAEVGTDQAVARRRLARRILWVLRRLEPKLDALDANQPRIAAVARHTGHLPLGKPLIELERVSKEFAKGKVVVELDRMEIREGEVLAIVGANGSGKTTLLRLIAKRLVPTSGEVRTGLPRHAIRYVPAPPPRRFARVDTLLALAAREAGFRGDELGERVLFFAGRFGIHRFMTRTHAGLSIGEQLRVSLATALISRPSLVVLDEPLANLDTGAQRELVTTLALRAAAASDPCAIAFSTQHIELAERVAHRVLVLDRSPRVKMLDVAQPAQTSMFEVSLVDPLSSGQVAELVRLQDCSLFDSGLTSFVIESTEPIELRVLVAHLDRLSIRATSVHDVTRSAQRFMLEPFREYRLGRSGASRHD